MNNTVKTIMALAEDFATAYAAANTMQSMQSDDERLERARKALEDGVSGLMDKNKLFLVDLADLVGQLTEHTGSAFVEDVACAAVNKIYAHLDASPKALEEGVFASTSTTPAAPTDVPDVDLFECDVEPRSLEYPLSDYHYAPSHGPLNFTWRDKPHRLLYDLIAAVRFYESAQAVQPVAPMDSDIKAIRHALMTGLAHNEALFALERLAENIGHAILKTTASNESPV